MADRERPRALPSSLSAAFSVSLPRRRSSSTLGRVGLGVSGRTTLAPGRAGPPVRAGASASFSRRRPRDASSACAATIASGVASTGASASTGGLLAASSARRLSSSAFRRAASASSTARRASSSALRAASSSARFLSSISADAAVLQCTAARFDFTCRKPVENGATRRRGGRRCRRRGTRRRRGHRLLGLFSDRRGARLEGHGAAPGFHPRDA